MTALIAEMGEVDGGDRVRRMNGQHGACLELAQSFLGAQDRQRAGQAGYIQYFRIFFGHGAALSLIRPIMSRI